MFKVTITDLIKLIKTIGINGWNFRYTAKINFYYLLALTATLIKSLKLS